MTNKGITIKVELQTEEIERLTNQIHARGKKLPLRRLGVLGVRSVLRNFAESGRPKKWKPITHRVGKPLLDTGRLRNSIEHVIIGDANVKIWSPPDMVYAGVHNFGFPERNIAARPFMMWQDEDVVLAQKMLADYLIEGK